MVEESIIYLSDAASHGIYKKPLINEASGSVIFTDGHFIVRVSGLTEEEISFAASMINSKEESRDVPASATGILEKALETADVNYFISTEKLSTLIEKIEKANPDKSTVTCPECKGRGEVEFEYYAATDRNYYHLTGECPICSGMGLIENPDKLKYIRLDNSPLSFQTLKLILDAAKGIDAHEIILRKLPKEHTKDTMTLRTDELMFLFDISSPDSKKIEVGVMCVLPAFLSDRNTKSIELKSIIER